MWDHGRREREAGEWLVSGRQVAGERMMSEGEREESVCGRQVAGVMRVLCHAGRGIHTMLCGITEERERGLLVACERQASGRREGE